jgi:hypothetical protein
MKFMDITSRHDTLSSLVSEAESESKYVVRCADQLVAIVRSVY